MTLVVLCLKLVKAFYITGSCSSYAFDGVYLNAHMVMDLVRKIMVSFMWSVRLYKLSSSSMLMV